MLLSDPSMNKNGDVVFSEFSLSGTKNVFVYNKKTKSLSRPLKNYVDIIQRGSHFKLMMKGSSFLGVVGQMMVNQFIFAR